MTAQSPSADRSARVLVRTRPGVDEKTKKSLFTGGSVLGAVAMSSCCILPLALFSLGVTGAWIGNLTALYPYKLYFLIPTAAFLAGGFYLVYRRPRANECEPGGGCVTSLSDRINRVVLWSATLLTAMALAFPYVAPALLDI